MSLQAAQVLSALVLVVAALGFDLYCLRDLAQADVVLGFTPQVWSALIIVATPFGGTAYLMLGRPR